MSRKAPKITIDQLKQELLKAYAKLDYSDREDEILTIADFNNNRFNLIDGFVYADTETQFMKDIKKINFDFENHSWSEYFSDLHNSLINFHTLSNGFTFVGCAAGGDWETPVFFIMYWDGKNIRGYVPEDGNTFNPRSRTAFGSEGEDRRLYLPGTCDYNLSFFRKTFPSHLSEINAPGFNPIIFDEEWYQEGLDPEPDPDWVKIEADIIARIQVI